jgi:hypothetical protein
MDEKMKYFWLSGVWLCFSFFLIALRFECWILVGILDFLIWTYLMNFLYTSKKDKSKGGDK